MAKKSTPDALRYVGKGNALVGIPSRDMSADDIAVRAEALEMPPAALTDWLLESGLYIPMNNPAPAADDADGTPKG